MTRVNKKTHDMPAEKIRKGRGNKHISKEENDMWEQSFKEESTDSIYMKMQT